MATPDTIPTSSSGFNAMLLSNSSDSLNPEKPLSDKQYRQGIEKSISEVYQSQKELKELPSAKPPILTPPPKEEDYQTDPMKKFGSFGTVLATLGSLLTRRPLTNALKAGAEVNNAISAGDSEKFKSAYSTWKANNENAWKMADWEQSNLKDLAQRIKDGEQGASERARLFGIATNNPSLETAAKMGQVVEYADAHAKALRDAQAAQEKADLKHDLFSGFIDDYKQKNGKVPSPSDMAQAKLKIDKEVESKAGKESAGVTLTDDSINELAQRAIAGDTSALTGLGRGDSPNKTAVQNKIGELLKAQGMNGEDLANKIAEFGGMKQEYRTIALRAGAIKVSANELDRLIPAAEKAMEKVDLTDYPSLNSLENAVAQGTGDTNVVALNSAIQEVVGAYSNMLVRNGVPTDQSRTTARELINMSMSNPQKSAVFNQMKISKKAILEGVEDAKKQVSGKLGSTVSSVPVPTDADIDHLIKYPSDKVSFDKHFGEGSADLVLQGK